MNPMLLFLLIVLGASIFFILYIRKLLKNKVQKYWFYGLILFWGLLFLFAFGTGWREADTSYSKRILKNIVLIVGLGKFVFLVFALLDMILNALRLLVKRKVKEKKKEDSIIISRGSFLQYIGIFLALLFSGSLFYGWRNKYRYKVHRMEIPFFNLPGTFRGLRIVQISDIHSGSFTDKEAVNKGIEKVLSQKPDLIVFTGDLVNDRAEEMEHYKELFSKLKAPYGVYSILGNHDYGDYVHWSSEAEKEQNLEHLKAIHKEMGWHLLLNQHIYIHKNGEKIALIGVENWSKTRRFSRYGDLKKAYRNIQKDTFKILLSHDPTYWDEEVLSYKDIALTLSGHTHGMQFGVEIPFFKWSPIQYMYPRWAGLYQVGEQKLYVNRGFGFIGYQGRVGILPEITVMDLV